MACLLQSHSLVDQALFVTDCLQSKSDVARSQLTVPALLQMLLYKMHSTIKPDLLHIAVELPAFAVDSLQDALIDFAESRNQLPIRVTVHLVSP